MTKRTKQTKQRRDVGIHNGRVDVLPEAIDVSPTTQVSAPIVPIQSAPNDITTKLIRLDIGCGPNKRQANQGEAPWLGVDQIAFPGVDVVCDLNERWPWEDNSMCEGHSSHCIEHFDAYGRVHFVNELYRVLVPDGKCQIIVPHWASGRAYGDPSHCWPPVSEFWFYYLSKQWRMANAPHTDIQYDQRGFNCDMEATWGYSMHQEIALRSQQSQQFALQFYKEAAQDIVATLIARK